MYILADGGEWRGEVGGHGNIVEAHHRYIARDIQAMGLQGFDGAHGNVIAGGKDAVETEPLLQQGFYLCIT